MENHISQSTPFKPKSLVFVMVCIYIFLFIERPWESISFLNGVPVERAFAIVLIVMAILKNKFRTVTSPTNVWVYGLLALHFVLAPFAFMPGAAVDQGVEYAKMVVLYILILAVVDNDEELNIIAKVYVFSMIFYVTHSLWEYSNGRYVWRMGIMRMVGVDKTFSDPNSFGASILLSLPFAYALLRSAQTTLYRLIYCTYFVVAIICVVLTGSRSAFIGVVFVLLLWGLMRQGKRKYFVIASVLISLCVVWSVMPTDKQDRIRTLWDKDAGPAAAHESAEGRWLGLLAGWKMFTQVPLTGVGAGGKNFIGYRMAHHIDKAGEESPLQAHNLYGEVLAEFGIWGAVFLTGLIVSTIRCCSTAKKRLASLNETTSFLYLFANGILLGLLLLLLLGLVGHNFYRPLWLWLAAWAGCLVRLTSKDTNYITCKHSL